MSRSNELIPGATGGSELGTTSSQPKTREVARIWHPQLGSLKRMYDPTTGETIVATNTGPIEHPQAESPQPPLGIARELSDSEIKTALEERERQRVARARLIQEHTPDDVLLPASPSFAHRTDTAASAIKILNDGLWIRNYEGLPTTASGLRLRSGDKEKNDLLREGNALSLASRHSPSGRESRFVMIIAFPDEMPREVKEVYNAMEPQEKMGLRKFNAYLNWNVAKNNRSIVAVLPSQYITGVVDQDTGRYYTKQQFTSTFGNQS